jgi:predicted SprT family Zn-dependent metalloprotease
MKARERTTVWDFLGTIEAPERARAMAIEAGVAGLPVEWNTRLRMTGGRCHVIGAEPMLIDLNATLKGEEPKTIRGVFLHELAHAIAYKIHGPVLGAGHGAHWKAVCRAIGGTPHRTHRIEALAATRRPRKVVARCGKCGQEFHRARRMKRGGEFFHGRNPRTGIRCGGRLITV